MCKPAVFLRRFSGRSTHVGSTKGDLAQDKGFDPVILEADPSVIVRRQSVNKQQQKRPNCDTRLMGFTNLENHREHEAQNHFYPHLSSTATPTTWSSYRREAHHSTSPVVFRTSMGSGIMKVVREAGLYNQKFHPALPKQSVDHKKLYITYFLIAWGSQLSAGSWASVTKSGVESTFKCSMCTTEDPDITSPTVRCWNVTE